MKTHTMMTLFSLLLFYMAPQQEFTAYRQDIRGGAIRVGTSDDGRMFFTNNDRSVYYLYLRADQLPEIAELWINGEAFDFTVTEVKAAVVIKTGFRFGNGLQADTLTTPDGTPVYQIMVREPLKVPVKRGIQLGVRLVMKDQRMMHADIRQLPDAFEQ